MENLTYSKRSLVLFFVIVVVFSAVAEIMICTGGEGWWYLVLMWIPAAAAIVSNVLSIRDDCELLSLKSLLFKSGFHMCRPIYILAGFFIPLVYLLISYGMYWVFSPESFAYRGVSLWIVLKDCLPVTIIGTLFSLTSALGEEIGWRGFMVPAFLNKFGFNKMLVFSSLIWCVWHLPLIIAGDYIVGAPIWYQVSAFILCVFPIGVIIAILTIKSESIWPAALFHAAHNNFDQSVLSVITDGVNEIYYVGETGVFTIICVWVVAIIMYRQCKMLR